MEFPGHLIIEAFDAAALNWQELTSREHGRLVSEWCATYGALYDQPPGDGSRQGLKAQLAAEAACDGHFLVVPNRDPSCRKWAAVGTAFRCEGDSLPDLTAASHYVDLFISPEDMSWTLHYGHEVDVFGGPVFAWPPWDPGS